MKSINTRTRYNLCGGDFSGQEPRSLCAYAKDEIMQKAYLDKRDLYAQIGSICFGVPYESCLEFHPETHQLQPEGKARRSAAKVLFLGILYGMGPKKLADNINKPMDEAQKIIDNFYAGFQGVRRFTDESQEMLKKNGYVTDIFGRRRHLPDGALEPYEIYPMGGSFEFNPLLDSIQHEDSRVTAQINNYKALLEKAKWKKDKDAIIMQAQKDGFVVRDNGGFINRAMRQCLNARIQGSAASMTKLAMVMIHNDEELKRLGFKLLVTVHDEVFGQAPLVNAEAAGKRLCDVMIEAAKTKCGYTPWSVDPYMVGSWYQDELAGEVLKDYKKLKDGETIEKIYDKYLYLSKEGINKVVSGEFNPSTDSLK